MNRIRIRNDPRILRIFTDASNEMFCNRLNCSYGCKMNENRTYACFCQSGYALSEDGKSCKGMPACAYKHVIDRSFVCVTCFREWPCRRRCKWMRCLCHRPHGCTFIYHIDTLSIVSPFSFSSIKIRRQTNVWCTRIDRNAKTVM